MSKRIDQKSAARLVRDQLAQDRRRKRTMWISLGAVGLLVIAGLIGWSMYAANKTTDFTRPANTNAASTGVVTGSGPVTVDEYIDFLCPHCKAFHDQSGPTIAKLADAKKITLVTHPVAYLDAASTNQYSTRSSAASGCAADGGKFTQYADVLFANQPAEGTAGPSDDQLIAFGSQVGLGEPFATCVKDKRYVNWAKHVSTEAGKAGVTGTPTVMVNGKPVQPDAAAIVAAVAEASKSAPVTANPSASQS
jgi:protein-disulfide isomerase